MTYGISASPYRVAIFGFVTSGERERKRKRERWVQTFLVVKGRNLQLSNKSLRLNPSCDWLRRATWHTLYEHELYAVVYSLVLPLYQQQTKLGRRNVPFLPFLIQHQKHSTVIFCGATSSDIHPISDFLTEGSSGQSPPLPSAACVYPPRRQ